MKKKWAIRKDAEAVSPVIATILMVAITVVLAAVLYVMVLGFGTDTTETPTATYSKSSITNGQQINILSITNKEISWDDMTIQLSDGENFAEWEPLKTNLDGGEAVSSNLTTDDLGSLTVCCIVTDVAGNGFVSGSDYFKVYTYGGAAEFDSATTYTAVLIYEQTSERCGTGQTFTG